MASTVPGDAGPNGRDGCGGGWRAGMGGLKCEKLENTYWIKDIFKK